MKLFDRFIASFAPKYAIRRMQARQVIKNYYEAAKVSRLHTKKLNSSDPDTVTNNAIDSLRDSARHIEQNYDIGRGVLTVLIANTIGDGIKPIPMVRDKTGKLAKDFNDAAKGLFKNWMKNPEVTGDFDYYSMQQMLGRSFFRDGEVLMQHLEGNVPKLDHVSIVPYSIEMIEGDYLPTDLEDEARGITQGVQKNGWGKPTNFYIYKNNPDSSYVTTIFDTKRISADKITHMKLIDRIRQTRGVSIYASVINRFDDIKEIDENERVAARVAAAMAGYIRKGSPDMFIAPGTGKELREMEFVPGMIFDELQAGEEIGTIDTTRPNNELIPFRDSQLRAAAGGVAASFSSISKNYLGTYSAQRQELVEQYQNYGIIWSYLKNRMAQPIWERFIKMAVASGALDVSDIDESTLYDCQHTRPPLTWIDPQKEMAAIEKEISLGLVSRSDIILRRGGDPDEVFRKIAEEKELLEELGIDTTIKQDNQQTKQTDNTDGEDNPDNENNIDNEYDDIEVGAIVSTLDGFYLRKTLDGYEPVTP